MNNIQPSFLNTSCGRIFSIFHQGNENKPLIIIVPGYSENHLGPNDLFVYIARHLQKEGYNVLRFDFIGLGNSDPGKVLMSSMIKQLIEIIELCREKYRFKGIILIGHSRGFWISILAQDKIKDIRGLISLGGRVRNLKYFLSEMELNWLLQTKKDFKEYLEDDLKYDYVEYISKIRVPVLLIYGKKDRVVYYTEAFIFKEHYRGPNLEIKILEDADHFFSDKKEDIIKIISNFLNKL